MAALARAPAAMKASGGGDKKQQVGRSRLLSVAVVCFLLFLVFTLSSRYDATVLLDTRRGDFRPSSQGDGSSHGGEGELKQLAQQSNDNKAAVTEAEVEESVTREQSNNVGREAELESSATAAAAADATANSDEQAKPKPGVTKKERPFIN